MNCLKPVIVFDTGRVNPDTGKRVLTFKPPRDIVEARGLRDLAVPCGRCAACLKDRRIQWISRMRLEQFVSPCSTFLTLTYDNAHCPSRLEKSDVQKFLKRLRMASRDYGIPPFSVRYFFCGEYGSRTYRPHYHAVLFGVDMMASDWLPRCVGTTLGRRPRYCSGIVERLWPFGFNVVGSCSSASIRYVSKYVSKQYADPERRLKCFTMYSQGLGRGLFVDVRRIGRKFDYFLKAPFYERYLDGSVVLLEDGRCSSCRLPSCLDNYAERFAPDLYESAKKRRVDYALFVKPDLRSPLVRERIISTELADEIRKGVLDNET